MFSTLDQLTGWSHSLVWRDIANILNIQILIFLGTFPLSETNLLTAEEREQFLPATRTFASVLGKENVDPEEISLLLEQSRELSTLIPDNLIGRLGGGLGLGGLLSQ